MTKGKFDKAIADIRKLKLAQVLKADAAARVEAQKKRRKEMFGV